MPCLILTHLGTCEYLRLFTPSYHTKCEAVTKCLVTLGRFDIAALHLWLVLHTCQLQANKQTMLSCEDLTLLPHVWYTLTAHLKLSG